MKTIFKIDKITNELDRVLATLGLMFALIIIIVLILFLPETAYIYIEAPIMLFLACVVYLLIRKRIHETAGLSYLNELHANHSTILILNILFVTLFSYSIISVATRPELYSRPLGYFVATSLLVAILAVEILFLPNKKRYTSFVLLKIMLVALSLWWTPQWIFPSILGIDPWWHQMFTMKILELGYIPDGYGYSKLPIMHLIIGSTSLVIGLGYKFSTMFSINVFQIVGLVFVFLLGNFIYSRKVGLLASLLLTVADKHIDLGIAPRPITLSIILMVIIIYILFKANKDNSITLTSLTIFFIGVTILTHTVGSFIMLLLLFLFWFSFKIYNKINLSRNNNPITLTFLVLCLVAMLGWWMYATEFILHVVDLIKWGFRIDTPMWTYSETALRYMATIKLEVLLDEIGFNIFFLFFPIGAFYLLSKRFANKYGFILSLGSLTFITLLFFIIIFGLTGFHLARWYPVGQLIIVILLALGFFLICRSFKSNSIKASILVITVLFVSFFSITDPFANMDSPIYSKNTTIRYSYTESELNAADTFSDMWNGKIKTDLYYSQYLKNYRLCSEKKRLFSEDLSSNFIAINYTSIDGMVVIRDEITKKPIYIPGGTFMLNHDPLEKLSNLGYNRIYDTGSIHAFLQQNNSIKLH